MSDERENPIVPDPGAPVEEQASQDSTVQDAVDRAAAISEDGVAQATASAEAVAANAGEAAVAAADVAATEAADAEAAATQAHREAASLVDTQMNVDHPAAETTRVAEFVETPSAAAEPTPAAAPVVDTPVRDGEIRIGADHPMAALYMQTPMPPDLKGNRGAGALIALLATVAFAALYAGVIALALAPTFPPSTFLTEGLLPMVTSWGFIAGVVAFYIGLLVLVLIFGRAGWWAYVLFSLFVGVLVWGVTTLAFAFGGGPGGTLGQTSHPDGFIGAALELAFIVPTLGAAVLAREVAVWFGAWIGARGRKVTAKNAALLAEYEGALAEVRAQP